MNDKQQLRKWAKAFGKLREDASYKLVHKLIETDEYKQAKNIMLFYPIKNEVNLLELLQDNSKTFYLPKVDGKNLLCCVYKNGDILCESCFKTLEPTSKPIDKNIIDLVIVPALCCDKNNFRLGYGGGFYDRFLADYKGKTVVCLPKELVIDTIYPDEFDIAVENIITV